MYELVIILFIISFAMKIGLGFFRIRALDFSTSQSFQSYDFTENSKFQRYNQRLNIIRDTLVGIILFMILLFKIPAYMDNIFIRLFLNTILSDVFTILTVLFLVSLFMFTFECIKHRLFKSQSFDVSPPTKKIFTQSAVKFLLFLVPSLVFVMIFNIYSPISDKVIVSFIITLLVGIIAYNFYLKIAYKLDKTNLINMSEDVEKRLSEKLKHNIKIYKMITPNYKKFANAFAIKKRKTYEIWVSKDLLDILDEQEALSIIAHEIGHHIKRHVIKFKIMLIIQFAYYLFTANLILTRNELYYSFGYNRVSGAFALIIVLILYDFFNRLFMILTNYISRSFEYAADLYAAEFSGSVDLSNALLKIYQFNLMTPNLHPIDELVNGSHPSLVKRLVFFSMLKLRKEGKSI
jgi:STE24 endopeptidase